MPSTEGEPTTPLINARGVPPSDEAKKASVCDTDTTWISELGEAFTYKFLFLLFAVQCLVKGIVNTAVNFAAPFVFASYHVPGPQMQVYLGAMRIPWAMKPALGLLSDLLPIAGYRKAPYAIIVTVVSIFCLVSLGFFLTSKTVVYLVVLCLMGVVLQIASLDLLTQAKFAETLRAIPEKGPDLMSFVWINVEVGALIAVVCVGVCIEYMGARATMVFLIPPAALVFFPTVLGYFGETRLPWKDVVAECSIMMEQKEVFAVCIIMTVGSLVLAGTGIFIENYTLQFIITLSVLLTTLVSMTVFLRPSLAKINAFFMLFRMSTIDIQGAAFYFYTDDKTQYPEGPHFSPTFYTTGIGLATSFVGLIAVAFYNRFMRDWSYHRILCIPFVVWLLVALSDIMIFTRYNLVLGIPDAVYVLGSSSIHTASEMWMFLPAVVMLSQLCPKGRMEATVYAILAGARNLGRSCGDYIGAYILSVVGVNPSGRPGESKEFENLWIAQLIVALAPLLVMPLLFILIPNAKQTEKLIQDNEGSATHGSLWSRWTQKQEKGDAV